MIHVGILHVPKPARLHDGRSHYDTCRDEAPTLTPLPTQASEPLPDTNQSKLPQLAVLVMQRNNRADNLVLDGRLAVSPNKFLHLWAYSGPADIRLCTCAVKG